MENKNADLGQNSTDKIRIGDDVTINGVIIFVNGIQAVVETKGGRRLFVREEDINTVRPTIKIPDKDERRGK